MTFGWRQMIIRAIQMMLIASVVAGCAPEGRESFGNKAEWSSLQTLEAAHRSETLNEPTIIHTNDQAFAAVPAMSARQTVWIMMRPEHAPFYKQMPGNVQFTLTLAELDRIEREGKPSPTVAEALRSHLHETEKQEREPNQEIHGTQ